MRYFVDTNIWIKWLRKESIIRDHLAKTIMDRHEVIVTPIAYFEVVRGLKKRNDKEGLSAIHKLWSALTYVEASKRVWDVAIEIWVEAVRTNNKREDADVITAAFARVYDGTIVTRDAHFDSLGVSRVAWN